MNLLKIYCAPKLYSEYSDGLDIWGTISVVIIDKNSGDALTLLQTEWDILNLADWFSANRELIPKQSLNINGETVMSGESIAEALHRFQERDIESVVELDIWHDAIAQSRFWVINSLRNALKGADVPAILIGCNKGHGEISLVDENLLYSENPVFIAKRGTWSYQFDMHSFLSDLTFELISTLKGIPQTRLTQHIQEVLLELERPFQVTKCGAR